MNKNELKTSKLIGINYNNSAIIILIMRYIILEILSDQKKELHMKRKFRED